MGIDLFVGSLSRYFCHDWETTQQRAWRAMGMAEKMSVVTPQGVRKALQGREAQRVREVVVRYRNVMVQQFQRSGSLDGPPGVGVQGIAWNESHEAPHFVEGPNRYEYAAFLLYCAYDHHPELMPTSIDYERYPEDSALRACADDLAGPYSHLVTGVTLWTPLPVKQPVLAPHPNGTKWRVASLKHALAQLERLNKRGWGAAPSDVERWLGGKVDASTEFEQLAQRGFAVFQVQIRRALDNNVCAVLDT